MPNQVYFIPNGPANVEDLFPDVDWPNVQGYIIHVIDDTDTTIATSTINWLNGECCIDKFRIHFLNFLGGIDAVNACIVTNEFEAKSDSFQSPTEYLLQMAKHGTNRFNVKANNVVTLAINDYPQDANEWINELLATPMAWVEVAETLELPAGYIPIIIVDGKILDVTEEDRFNNQIRIQLTFSYDKFIIRGGGAVTVPINND